jgi:hypothetical protein
VHSAILRFGKLSQKGAPLANKGRIKAPAIKARSGAIASIDVVRFIHSLAKDLRMVGMKPRITRRGRTIQLSYVARTISTGDQKRIAKMIRSRQLSHQHDFIRRVENSLGELPFITGRNLQIKRIKPEVHICRTPYDFAIHRYCRLTQTVPSGPRTGRRIAALVYDAGQRSPAVMGALMLASPLYSVRARDEFLGWTKSLQVKNLGLKRAMDLSLCMALPPYNCLRAGKLVATLAVSDTLSKEFALRYRNKLLAITTTCATGLHCPIFNRIMIRPGGLYRRIGETTGYSAMIFSDKTVAAARNLIKMRCLAQNYSMWNTTRILKTALTYCGVSAAPLFQTGNRKGVYIALSDTRSRQRLITGHSLPDCDMITDGSAIDFWKRNILARRVKDPETGRKINLFTFRRLKIPRET